MNLSTQRTRIILLGLNEYNAFNTFNKHTLLFHTQPFARKIHTISNNKYPPIHIQEHHTPTHFPSYNSNEYFKFEILHKSTKSHARVGRIHTPHGIIETPSFVSVATNACIKCLDPVSTPHLTNQQLIFCNTYHMIVHHSGADTVQEAGGLHKYINYSGPIITDSGGFQVFSMMGEGEGLEDKTEFNENSGIDELKGKRGKVYQGSIVSVKEEGVVFKSYRDGQKISLTPESSVEFQKKLGADIIIPFDELLPYDVSEEKLHLSLYRTHRWEARSLLQHISNPLQQAMYGVIHGGNSLKLREESIQYLTSLPFDGFAIGGSIGRNKDEMLTLLQFIVPLLPYEKPNHLLGIGDIASLELCVPLGIDSFDSSYPTRAARHGKLLTKNGDVSAKKAEHSKKFTQPIDPLCKCYTCQNYSVAYIHHLYKANEPSSGVLGTIHNLYFMNNMMREYREKIMNNEV